MKKTILKFSAIALIATATLVTSCKKTDSDTTEPVVSLNGNATTYAQLNKTFTDPGASAHDDNDGAVNVTSAGTVNTATAGTYVITYTAKDAAGNKGTATRTVYVVNFDGSYNLVQSACTDPLANGSGSSTVSASGVTAANGMTITNYGLWATNTVTATFDGNTVTVARQASATGTAGDQIEGTGTITGTGTGSDPIKMTFQFKERDSSNAIFNQGSAVLTHL